MFAGVDETSTQSAAVTAAAGPFVSTTAGAMSTIPFLSEPLAFGGQLPASGSAHAVSVSASLVMSSLNSFLATQFDRSQSVGVGVTVTNVDSPSEFRALFADGLYLDVLDVAVSPPRW